MKKPEKISSSLEDYLEVIAEIIEQKGHAHTKDIADKLGIKMPSVTNALQTLSAKGFIVYRSHAPVVLTASGTERAAEIRHRHSALKTFCQEILKLNEQESDDTACKMEHVVGSHVMSRFVFLTESIMTHESCSRFRDYLNNTMPKIAVDDQNDDLISLDQLPVGKTAVVMKISSTLRGAKKFADLGLIQGTFLTMEGSSPFGDLIRFSIMGSSLSMRAKDAAYIWVRLAASDDFVSRDC